MFSRFALLIAEMMWLSIAIFTDQAQEAEGGEITVRKPSHAGTFYPAEKKAVS